MGKVIYLTGAPATGKSSLGRALANRFSDLDLFSYSQELRKYVESKTDSGVSEDDIRRQSSILISPEDVDAVDVKLTKLVSDVRNSRSIVIDSHAVTKERYGFRVTPFSGAMLSRLQPDVIVCLYASAETIIARIAEHAAGRPNVSVAEADMHSNLQNSLAVQYAAMLGKPCYLIDSGIDPSQLLEITIECVKLT